MKSYNKAKPVQAKVAAPVKAAPAKPKVAAAPVRKITKETQKPLDQVVKHKLSGLFPEMKITGELMQGFDRIYQAETPDQKKYNVIVKMLWRDSASNERMKKGASNAIPLTNTMSKFCEVGMFHNAQPIGLNDNYVIMIQREVAGRKMLAHQLVKDKQYAHAIGRHLAAMHEGSKHFMKANPELIENFPVETNEQGLDLPPNEENFGIVHGNFDLFNFHMINRPGQSSEVASFNFDEAKQSWYLYDLGSVIFDVCFRLQEQAVNQMDDAHVLELQKSFCDWICESYTNGKYLIDREQLRKACCMRRDAFKQLIEEDMKSGQNAGDLVKFLKKVEQGGYQFYDVCIKPPEALEAELKQFEQIAPKKVEAPMVAKPQAPALKFEVVIGKHLDG